MAKKIAAQRQKEIVELLEKNGGYKMTELAEIFQVSKETIRRDLIHLNERKNMEVLYLRMNSSHNQYLQNQKRIMH